MNAVVIVAALLERLPYLFPNEEANDPSRSKLRAELEDKLVPVREQLKQIIFTEYANYNNIKEHELKEILKISCDLEDLIESYALEVVFPYSRRNYGLFPNRNIFRRYSLEMKIMKKLEQLLKIQLPNYSNTLPDRGIVVDSRLARQFFRSELLMDNEETYGMRNEESELMKILATTESSQLSLVSICGLGGSGKTALARRLFNSLNKEYYFQIRVWICVSQVFETGDILHLILSSISSSSETEINPRDLTQDELTERIYTSLKEKRYLIVFDDVWSADFWFSLRMVFPNDNNGSRILITTRIRSVALEMGIPNPYIHEMRILSEEECWALFQRKARLTGRSEGMWEIGMRIVKLVRGQPLAIVVLAGMLGGQPIDIWKRVLHQLNGIMTASNTFLKPFDILSLSYKQFLPLHLRPCLLYLSNFPNDSEIEIDTACQLWIAEGLISMENTRNGETIMDVAARYLYELVERGWIIISNQEVPGERRFGSCLIHDEVRDFCKMEGKEEEFLEVIDEDRLMSSPIRHAIHLDTNECNHSHLYGNADYLRALLFFDTSPCEEGYIRPREILNLEIFIWLRVLYLYGVDFKHGKLPKGVDKLVYLRFLSLRNCYLVELPPPISNMLYLQTLDLRIRNECEMIISDGHVLDNLERLKHLYLPLAGRTRNDHEKLILKRLKELEILVNFSPDLCNPDDLIDLIKLKELTIINFDCYSAKRLNVVEKMFNSRTLLALQFEGHLSKLPEIVDKSSSRLTQIILNGTQLTEDPMQILQELPNLRILVLEEAFVGKKIKDSSYGFKKLRYLKLSNLNKLEGWESDRSAMPELSTLVIEGCKKLTNLPDRFKIDIPIGPNGIDLKWMKRGRGDE